MNLDVFVINLPQRTDKKESMLKQAQAFDIPLHMVEAVNGHALSDEQIQKLVKDYPACCLTKGVIGCALSHIKVYKKIVDEHIPLALVLEDDAILTHEVKPVLEALSRLDQNDCPMVYLLSPHHYVPKGGEPLIGQYALHRYIDGSAAHAYVINQKAAEVLHQKLLPIVWEADKWYYFEQMGYVSMRCVVPHVTIAQGEPAYSDLFGERSLMVRKRRKYLGRLKRVVPWHEKLKKLCWKVTRRPFVQKS